MVQFTTKDLVKFKSPLAEELYEVEIERIQLTKLLKDTKKPELLLLGCFFLLSLAGSKTYTET